MKVYCSECKYVGSVTKINSLNMNNEPLVDCMYRDNIILDYIFDNFYEKRRIYKKERLANEINENNDCEWFEEEINENKN